MRRFSSVLFAFLLATLSSMPAGASSSYANIPAGTRLNVRVSENLSSETANEGDVFHGTLTSPVTSAGRTIFPKGAQVTGTVVQVERSGRLSHPGELHLILQSVRANGRTYALETQPFVIRGESHTKSNVGKIGGGAAAGAIIGAIAGGGKGAAIGAGVGAAAGTGVAAATGKRAAEVESEAVLTWVTTVPSETSAREIEPPAPRDRRYVDRDDDDDRDRYRGVHDSDRDEDAYASGPDGFGERDREIIRDCFLDNRSNLPPGLAKRDRLPPGLERQLQRNGTLPPGLQKRVQPLPGYCTARLPRLPHEWERVVLSGRIILLDPRLRIVDMFWLEEQD